MFMNETIRNHRDNKKLDSWSMKVDSIKNKNFKPVICTIRNHFCNLFAILLQAMQLQFKKEKINLVVCQ